MLRMIEAVGDRLLTLVVPRVRAAADPGCECSQYGAVITPYCACGHPCTAGGWGRKQYARCVCDGCRWSCSGCGVTEGALCAPCWG
jgi:hypothetical protein